MALPWETAMVGVVCRKCKSLNGRSTDVLNNGQEAYRIYSMLNWSMVAKVHAPPRNS